MAKFTPCVQNGTHVAEIQTEQKIALNTKFQDCGQWDKDVFYRGVIDVSVLNNDHALIGDYKTGKVANDTTQLQLMSATLFAFDPQIQRVKAALLFVAHGQMEREEYVRGDLTEIWGEILPRVKLVERARAAQHYPPTPSGLCRKYCAVVSCPHHGR